MNRVVFESSPMQHMMAGNPNSWNINTMRPPSHHSSSFFPPNGFLPQYTMHKSSLSMPSWHENQEPLESWSQLLQGGVAAEEDRRTLNHFLPNKCENNWEKQQLIHQCTNSSILHDVRQENFASSYGYGPHASNVFQPMIPVSSPQSCVTSLSSNNFLDFSSNKPSGKHPHPDGSSECNSIATGRAAKKARVQSSSQTTFKVRKEKLGDRITTLHQIISPFGKTDTASVLLESIGYIRFLHSQIEALSLPYLSSEPGNMRQPQPEGVEEPKKDLRSKGLFAVPISCIMQVGSDNGADYWAPAFGGGI